MNRDSLADWLAWQDSLHWQKIDLGLARLLRVYERLSIAPVPYAVITIGGTNGKGSCVAITASILRAAGYRVGTFTSPHLVRYNERIQINGVEASDASLIAAFERIEAVRGGETLTYFEFNTLAALLIFQTAGLDVAVLEVGMGGRLDTVNIIDADVALIASVSLDHCEYLGNDIDAIGREKAGIFRSQRHAIYGSRAMPGSIMNEAQRLGVRLQRLGREFDFEPTGDSWTWHSAQQRFEYLPAPALPGAIQFENASASIAAVTALHDCLPVTAADIAAGLRSVRLRGRYEAHADQAGVTWIFDVAHNPDATRELGARLNAEQCAGRTIAVCGIVADKDIDGVVQQVREVIDIWLAPQLQSARALNVDEFAQRLRRHGADVRATFPSVSAACEEAALLARSGDRVIVFGSFTTVGPALEWFDQRGNG